MKRFFSAFLLVCVTLSMNAQQAPSAPACRAADPNQVVGEALKTTGTVSLSVGVPCLAAGMACLMYANFAPNPMDGYTTSQSKAAADSHLQYISLDEYQSKAQKFTSRTHAAEVAGYILMPMGGALTVIGIPLYIRGNQLTVQVLYIGNGAGLALNF